MTRLVPQPGQVVTVFRNRLRGDAHAYPDHAARMSEHREAQREGVRGYYEEYSISVGEVDRASDWRRPGLAT